MGMDWHSSGITTSVIGALKRGLAPLEKELGIHVCGGRGKHSRRTPHELVAAGDRVGFDGEALATVSRLIAKVDSAAVQDGFQLYLHGFIVTDDGRWVVVQQGMNDGLRQARRYHWLSEGLQSFLDDPHAAIDGPGQGEIVNLADRRAEASRGAQLALLADLGPDGIAREHAMLSDRGGDAAPAQPMLPHLSLPAHHDVRPGDVVARRLHATLAAAADRAPADFQALLLTPGVGERTVLALAMVAEVVHGAPCRFSDPARFSFAHGGKDGHPFPVPLRVHDETIRVLKSAVQAAKLGRAEELAALKRLDDQARQLEAQARGPGVAALIAEERRQSHAYGGRSVFGWAQPPEEGSPAHTAEPSAKTHSHRVRAGCGEALPLAYLPPATRRRCCLRAARPAPLMRTCVGRSRFPSPYTRPMGEGVERALRVACEPTRGLARGGDDEDASRSSPRGTGGRLRRRQSVDLQRRARSLLCAADQSLLAGAVEVAAVGRGAARARGRAVASGA
jgi:hypothetical protein